MNKINLKSLKEYIDSLVNLQSQFGEANVGFFKTIEKTSDFWQDKRASSFYNEITKEKVVSRRLRNNLKKIGNIYQYVYDEYCHFGELIEYDSDNKEAILNKLDYTIEQLDVINKRFSNLNTDFIFDQKNLLSEQKNKSIDLKGLLENYREDLKKFFEQVEIIEIEVKRKIGDLDQIRIDEPIID